MLLFPLVGCSSFFSSEMDAVHAVKCWNHLIFFLANWNIPSILSLLHPHPTRPACCFCEEMCVWMFVEDSSGWCWWGDYLPPRPLWSAANGTNCTVLSLMHWWAFSISAPLSCMLPPASSPSPLSSLIQSPHNMSEQCVARRLDGVRYLINVASSTGCRGFQSNRV